MTTPGYKIPVVRSRESSVEPPRSVEPRPRSESMSRRNSIDNSAMSFAENCEKLAARHSTNKVQVILDTVIKVLEALKK